MNDVNPNSVQSRRDNVVIQLLQLCRGRRAREGGSVPHAYPHNLNKCTTYPSQPHIIRGTAPVPSIVDLAPTLIKNTLVPIYRSAVMAFFMPPIPAFHPPDGLPGDVTTSSFNRWPGKIHSGNSAESAAPPEHSALAMVPFSPCSQHVPLVSSSCLPLALCCLMTSCHTQG